MLATVPSCGATTGISIFMASTTTPGPPALSAWPTFASTLKTFPAAPAVTLMLPAPEAGAAALGAAFGAALGAAFTAGAAGAAPGGQAEVGAEPSAQCGPHRQGPVRAASGWLAYTTDAADE